MDTKPLIPERDLSKEKNLRLNIFSRIGMINTPTIEKFAIVTSARHTYFLYMVEIGFVTKAQAFNDTNVGTCCMGT